MRTIAVINQKGGVGKTTTVANLGSQLAMRGRNVCLIDMDPQTHLSLHLGIDGNAAEKNLYHVIADNATISQSSVKVKDTLWVLPASTDLAAAETELAGDDERNTILSRKLAAEQLPYQYVMIDCPPSLGLLTMNALTAADDVIIPMQPHFLALQGLGKLLETVRLVREHLNPKIRVAGVIFCMYESMTKLATEVVNDLQDFLKISRHTDTPWSDARIFARVVRRNIKLAECPSHGTSIFEYDPSSHGAQDYSILTDQFLEAFEKH